MRFIKDILDPIPSLNGILLYSDVFLGFLRESLGLNLVPVFLSSQLVRIIHPHGATTSAWIPVSGPLRPV